MKSETWRDAYDSWKLRGPDEEDEDIEAREEARERAEDAAVDRYVEEHQEATHRAR